MPSFFCHTKCVQHPELSRQRITARTFKFPSQLRFFRASSAARRSLSSLRWYSSGVTVYFGSDTAGPRFAYASGNDPLAADALMVVMDSVQRAFGLLLVSFLGVMCRKAKGKVAKSGEHGTPPGPPSLMTRDAPAYNSRVVYTSRASHSPALLVGESPGTSNLSHSTKKERPPQQPAGREKK